MQISRVQEILGGRLGSYSSPSFYHLGNHTGLKTRYSPFAFNTFHMNVIAQGRK